jgi:magnesium transporter
MTSLKGMISCCIELKHQIATSYDLDLLEDVEIELRQAQETTNIYSDILTGTMDAYASVISNNMNNSETNDVNLYYIDDSLR